MITFSKLGDFGRLGNQMFQIASTIGISYRNFANYSFPAWKYRDDFQYKLPVGVPSFTSIYTELEPYYKEVELFNGIHWDLVGYFQSWKYFEDVKDTIRNVFYFNKTEKNGVAIHVRRGDYLQLQHVHPVLPMSYYENALTYFPNEHLAIFSDDIEWCKQNFKYSDAEFIHTDSDINDFKLMASHNKFIMANSSFSWWAAYLSKSIDVIAPKNYVTGETKDDRLLPEWTKL